MQLSEPGLRGDDSSNSQERTDLAPAPTWADLEIYAVLTKAREELRDTGGSGRMESKSGAAREETADTAGHRAAAAWGARSGRCARQLGSGTQSQPTEAELGLATPGCPSERRSSR